MNQVSIWLLRENVSCYSSKVLGTDEGMSNAAPVESYCQEKSELLGEKPVSWFGISQRILTNLESITGRSGGKQAINSQSRGTANEE